MHSAGGWGGLGQEGEVGGGGHLEDDNVGIKADDEEVVGDPLRLPCS